MKYKVKIKEVQPLIFSASEKLPQKCFLGVSLSNPFFQGKHLERVLNWINNNFSECHIVIADHLHRFNEYTFNNKNTSEAEVACKRLGDEIYNNILLLTNSFHNQKFKIYRWLNFTQTNDFILKSAQINNHFISDSEFRTSVLQSCEDFIDKQINRGYHIGITREDAVNKSKEYLLEEMAVFSLLIGMGYTVQVYPGTQLKVLKELANKKILGVDDNLSKGIYIDLSIKKIK